MTYAIHRKELLSSIAKARGELEDCLTNDGINDDSFTNLMHRLETFQTGAIRARPQVRPTHIFKGVKDIDQKTCAPKSLGRLLSWAW